MRSVCFLAITLTAFACAVSSGQVNPTIVSVSDLAEHPKRFDGQLVRVHARLEFGWEGDNFLSDATTTSERDGLPRRKAAVWIYCKSDKERFVWGVIGRDASGGTFTGYFHFVPDKKSRMKDVFDPGPFQLEAISVSDVEKLPK